MWQKLPKGKIQDSKTRKDSHIMNYYRNVNQNYNEDYLTQSECPSSKHLQTINAGEGEEKRNPSTLLERM